MNHDLEGKGFMFDLYSPQCVKNNILRFKPQVDYNFDILDIITIARKIMSWFNIPYIHFYGNRSRMSIIDSRCLEQNKIKLVGLMTGTHDIWRIDR